MCDRCTLCVTGTIHHLLQDPRNAPCFYPMPNYTVARKQSATFQLKGSLVRHLCLQSHSSTVYNSVIKDVMANAIKVISGDTFD